MSLAIAFSTSYLALLIPSLLIGLGASVTMPAATIATLHSVPIERAGIASGAFNASRQTGSLLGIAIFGSIVNAAGHFVSGMYICFAIAGVMYLAACCVAFFCIAKPERDLSVG